MSTVLFFVLIAFTTFAGTFGDFALYDSDEPDGFRSRTVVSGCDKNISLAVYYDSKCNGTEAFILEHLMPVANKKYKWLHIKLIPYGLAEIRDHGITCLHGPQECLMNRVHICSFEQLPDDTQKGEFKRIQVAQCLITNILKDPEPKKIGSMCSTRFGLDWSEIEKCAWGPEGKKLEREYLDMASKVHAPTSPYVAFNNQVGNRGFQMDVLGDLWKMVKEIHCDEITVPTTLPTPKPRPTAQPPGTCPAGKCGGGCKCSSTTFAGKCCDLLAQGYTLQETHSWKLIPPAN